MAEARQRKRYENPTGYILIHFVYRALAKDRGIIVIKRSPLRRRYPESNNTFVVIADTKSQAEAAFATAMTFLGRKPRKGFFHIQEVVQTYLGKTYEFSFTFWPR